MLEKIIAASSNPGDIVLDAFCGCGTTLAVAQRLGRCWIGIDNSLAAIELTQQRLNELGATEDDFDFINALQEDALEVV